MIIARAWRLSNKDVNAQITQIQTSEVFMIDLYCLLMKDILSKNQFCSLVNNNRLVSDIICAGKNLLGIAFRKKLMILFYIHEISVSKTECWVLLKARISQRPIKTFSVTPTQPQRYKPDVSSIRLLQRFFLEHFNTSDALDLVFLFTLVF